MADLESFIFGAGTPNLDYQALAQRRAIAQALAGRKRDYPKTVGEGMTYFGESLADAFDTIATGRQAASQRAAESKLIGGAPEGPAYTGTLSGAAPAPAGAPRADLQIEPQLAPGFYAGGEGSVDKPGRADQLGTTVGAYGDRYMASLGGGAPAPTRMAAVNLPGSTISDAAPIAAAPAARANPPTVTAEIKPAASSLPSAEPIPPASRQVMQPPGDEPQRPGIIGPTKPMTYWSNIMNNPSVSPGMQNYAKQKYEQESSHLGGIQKRQDEDFTHKRGVWQKKSDEWDKFVREEPDRAIAQLKERLALESSQAGIEKTRLEIAKAIHLRDGGEWESAVRKSRADAEEQEQKVKAGHAPPGFMMDGKRMDWDQTTGTWKEADPKMLPTGGGPPVVKDLTGEEGKIVTFHAKAATALEQMARIKDGDKILATGLKEELAGRIPFVGNALLSSKYRAMRHAADSLTQAHLRQLSGAGYTAQELASVAGGIIPMYGDDARTLAQKAEQRASVERGLYLSSGKGRPLIDYANQERAAAYMKAREGRKATNPSGDSYPEGTTRTKKSGEKQSVRGGYWEDDD